MCWESLGSIPHAACLAKQELLLKEINMHRGISPKLYGPKVKCNTDVEATDLKLHKNVIDL